MKVFGIGLNKTGTTTLGKALEILGYKYHIGYNAALCLDYIDGRHHKILDIARKANNCEDLPWPFMYEQVYNEIEHAKFILTKRKSSKDWIESYLKHSEREGPKIIRELFYGYKMPHGFEKQFIEIYERHNEKAAAFFSELNPNIFMSITFENGEGWEKLCDFLHKDIPDVPFPWLNRDPLSNNTL